MEGSNALPKKYFWKTHENWRVLQKRNKSSNTGEHLKNIFKNLRALNLFQIFFFHKSSSFEGLPKNLRALVFPIFFWKSRSLSGLRALKDFRKILRKKSRNFGRHPKKNLKSTSLRGHLKLFLQNPLFKALQKIYS